MASSSSSSTRRRHSNELRQMPSTVPGASTSGPGPVPVPVPIPTPTPASGDDEVLLVNLHQRRRKRNSQEGSGSTALESVDFMLLKREEEERKRKIEEGTDLLSMQDVLKRPLLPPPSQPPPPISSPPSMLPLVKDSTADLSEEETTEVSSVMGRTNKSVSQKILNKLHLFPRDKASSVVSEAGESTVTNISNNNNNNPSGSLKRTSVRSQIKAKIFGGASDKMKPPDSLSLVVPPLHATSMASGTPTPGTAVTAKDNETSEEERKLPPPSRLMSRGRPTAVDTGVAPNPPPPESGELSPLIRTVTRGAATAMGPPPLPGPSVRIVAPPPPPPFSNNTPTANAFDPVVTQASSPSTTGTAPTVGVSTKSDSDDQNLKPLSRSTTQPGPSTTTTTFQDERQTFIRSAMELDMKMSRSTVGASILANGKVHSASAAELAALTLASANEKRLQAIKQKQLENEEAAKKITADAEKFKTETLNECRKLVDQVQNLDRELSDTLLRLRNAEHKYKEQHAKIETDLDAKIHNKIDTTLGFKIRGTKMHIEEIEKNVGLLMDKLDKNNMGGFLSSIMERVFDYLISGVGTTAYFFFLLWNPLSRIVTWPFRKIKQWSRGGASTSHTILGGINGVVKSSKQQHTTKSSTKRTSKKSATATTTTTAMRGENDGNGNGGFKLPLQTPETSTTQIRDDDGNGGG